MRRLALAFAALLAAAASAWADETPELIATARDYRPDATIAAENAHPVERAMAIDVAQLTLTGVSLSGSSYVQPTPGVLIAQGDSIPGNGGAVVYSGGSLTATTGGGKSFMGEINLRTTVPNTFWVSGENAAVGASTSAGTLFRLPVASNAATGNPAETSVDGDGTNAGDGNYSVSTYGTTSPLNNPANVVILNVYGNDLNFPLNPNAGVGNIQYSIDNLTQMIVAYGPAPGGNLAPVYQNAASPTVPSGTFLYAAPGANDILLLTSSQPRGRGINIQQTSTSPFTVSSTGLNPGTFESYNCNGTLSTPVIASNYAAGVRTLGTNTALTYTTGTPAQGQFSVTAGGQYTFNASDVAISGWTVSISYCFRSNPYGSVYSAGLAGWLDGVGFFRSKAANYYGIVTGINYGVPGGQYYAHTKLIDSVVPTLDPATLGTIAGWTTAGYAPICAIGNAHYDANACPNLFAASSPGANEGLYLPYMGYLCDGDHPCPLGARAWAQSTSPVLEALYGNTPVVTPPTLNNELLSANTGQASYSSVTGGGVSTATPLSAFLAGQFEANTAGGMQICWMPTTTPVAANSAICGTIGASVSGQGSISGTGVTSGCFNYTAGTACNGSTAAGAFKITFSSTPGTGKIIAVGTPANLLPNGQLNFNSTTYQGTGTTTAGGTGCNSGSELPPGGYALTIDSGSIAQISGANAGQMTISCGYGTAPDGNPGYYISIYGQTGATTPSFALGVSATADVSRLPVFSVSQKLRGYVHLTYTAGPDGHLYGVGSTTVAINISNGTGSTINGKYCSTGTTLCTAMVGRWGDESGAGYSYYDWDLQDYGNTGDQMPGVTANIWTGNDSPTNTVINEAESVTINPLVNQAISVKIWVQNLYLFASPQ